MAEPMKRPRRGGIRCRAGLVMVLLALPALADSGIKIEAPYGGWRRTDGDAAGFRQEVHYPASTVNSDGHALQALIKGRVAGTAKSRSPYRLIVNGVAMPLKVNEDGGFSRPYAFGKGSNGVEVRSPDGKERRRVQFYDAYPDRTQAKLRVVLSWDTDQTDLDLHVVAPDGQHVWYGNRTAPNGAALDVDVTTGYGPEIYASPAPPKGVYHVYVNYYGAGEDRGTVTVAQVAVVGNEGTVHEKQQTFRVPLRKPGELTLVKSFTYP